jgi:O-antigen/teichoic acid export membrane protein
MNSPQNHSLTAESDRARRRNRNAILTSSANIASKLVAVLTSFATIPLTLHYLGPERFGLWMTISSFSALLAFADLGIGNGVLNAIAEASGRNDRKAIRQSIASAAAMLTMASLLISSIIIPIVLLLNWNIAFNLHDIRAQAEVVPALLVFSIFQIINIVTGISGRIQMALQQGFFNGIINAIGSLLGLAGVLLAIHRSADLPWLILSLMGGPLLATLAGAAIFFLRAQQDLLPKWEDINIPTMRRLAKIGGLFFTLQLASSFAYSSDNSIAAHYIGATAVGDYAVVSKIFSAISIITGMLLQPLWPAYGEAIARKDIAWVRQTLKKSIIASGGAAAIGCLILFIGFEFITNIWLHRNIDASSLLLIGFCAWSVIDAIGNSFAMLLNGAHIVRFQVIVALINATTCFIIKTAAAQAGHLDYLPWITSGTYVICTLIPYLILVPRIMAKKL